MLKNMVVKCKVLAFVLLAFGVAGCSKSYDLGADKPFSVKVDTLNPNWDNGIGELMERKCANCHATFRGKLVPSDTPADLDLGNEDTVRSKICRVKERVFNTPDKPMPPNFSTPMDENEKLALKVYVDAVDPCAVATPDPGANTSLLWADVQAIADRDCKICHTAASPSGSRALSTLEEWKAGRIRAIARINDVNSPMPPGNPTYKDSTDGKKLLEWLNGGADVK